MQESSANILDSILDNEYVRQYGNKNEFSIYFVSWIWNKLADINNIEYNLVFPSKNQLAEWINIILNTDIANLITNFTNILSDRQLIYIRSKISELENKENVEEKYWYSNRLFDINSCQEMIDGENKSDYLRRTFINPDDEYYSKNNNRINYIIFAITKLNHPDGNINRISNNLALNEEFITKMCYILNSQINIQEKQYWFMMHMNARQINFVGY